MTKADVVGVAGRPVRAGDSHVHADGPGIRPRDRRVRHPGAAPHTPAQHYLGDVPGDVPTHIRYAGFAISYNISTSLFGGTPPATNQYLINLTGDDLVPAYYMMAACVVGAIALLFVPETRGASLRGRGIPGVDTPPAALSGQV